MKSPEEIAKALHLCYNPPSSCDDCPYCDCKDCVSVVAKDAEECIQELVEKGNSLNKWLETVSNHSAAINEAAVHAVEQMANRIPRWISVEERLPERGITKCSACVKCGDGLKRVVCASYNAELQLWTGWHGEKIGNEITHWMPLPEPPKEE